MKIVKKGRIVVHYHGECDKCGCECEFDYDEVTHFWADGEHHHTVPCPTEGCDELLEVEQMEK